MPFFVKHIKKLCFFSHSSCDPKESVEKLKPLSFFFFFNEVQCNKNFEEVFGVPEIIVCAEEEFMDETEEFNF